MDPIDHISSVASAKGDSVVSVHVVQLRLDVFEEHLKVFVRPSPILVVDIMHELLAVTGSSANVRGDDYVPLFGKDGRVPARRPGFIPSTYWAAVDQKSERVPLRSGEEAGLDYPGVDLLGATASVISSGW